MSIITREARIRGKVVTIMIDVDDVDSDQIGRRDVSVIGAKDTNGNDFALTERETLALEEKFAGTISPLSS